MMKKVHLFHIITWIILLAIICLLAPLNLRGILPSGTIIAPITALLAVAAIPLLGMLSSTLLVIASQLILLFFNQSNWLLVVVTALTVLFSGWVVRWQQANTRRLQHQQLITIGVSSGLIVLILLELAYCIVGWHLTGNGTGMFEIARLALPSALLTGLCYALLVPPIGLLLIRIGKKWSTKFDDEEEDANRSIIVDLSEQKKRQDKSNKKK